MVSWDSLAERYAGKVVTENDGDRETKAKRRRGRRRGPSRKVSRTDLDASMATSACTRLHEPCYKQHTAVDDARGVVLDVAVTTGAVSESRMIEAQVDVVRETTGRAIGTVTADAGCAYARVFGGLERRRIDPVIPTRKDPSRSPVPVRRFRYDARHHLVKCPHGKILHPVRRLGRGQVFLSRVSDCACCPLKSGCLPASRANKEVVVPHDYPALLRARRRRARWSEDDQRLYTSPLAFRGLPRRGQDLARARARYPARSRQHENPGLPHGCGDQSQAACRRPSCRPVGHLGTPRRRNGTLKSPSRPQQPNQPPNGRCRIVLHSPRSDGGFFNNPMIGKLLGHTQVETTARYAHLARDSVQESATRIADSIAADILGDDVGAGFAIERTQYRNHPVGGRPAVIVGDALETIPDVLCIIESSGRESQSPRWCIIS